MTMIAIWESEVDVKTKNMAYHKKMKPVKLNGRKPSKLIVHVTDNIPSNDKHIKKLVSYNGLVLDSIGRLIYDGRQKANV